MTDFQPGSLPALDHDALAVSIEAALAHESDPLRKARLHQELGRLCSRGGASQADSKRAAKHLLAAHELAPASLAAIVWARHALLEQGRYGDAVGLYDAELAQRGTPAQRARIVYEKGQLLESRLDQKPEALDLYAQAFELDPTNLDALRAAARLQRELARFSDLDRTLERMAVVLEHDPAQSAALILARARLAELRLGEPGQALELYLSALSLDPELGGAGEAIKRLAQAQGQWGKLLAALEREAACATQPEVAAQAWARIAEIRVDQLGELDKGIAALQAAVASMPNDRSWLERLARLLGRADRPREALGVLEQLLRFTTEPAEQVALSHRMGELAERQLQDAALAERHYLAALAIDPAHDPSRTALHGIYGRRRDHQGLLRLYEMELELETQPQARADLLVRIGELHEAGPEGPSAAVERYNAALALVAGHGLALCALDRLLPQLGRFDQLAQVYERVVDHAPDAALARNYLMRIGSLQEDRLANFAAAMHAYQRVLDRDAADLEALHGLQRAAERADDHVQLLRALDAEAALLERGPRWADLMYTTASLADSTGQPAAAAHRLQQLLDAEPQHALALRQLSEIYCREQRWDDLLGVFARRLPLAASLESQAALLVEMGRLCEVQLGRLDDAIEHYRRALLAYPTHHAAHHALLSALRKVRRYDALAEALLKRIEVCQDERERAQLAFELGSIHEHELAAPERAIEAYGRALEAVADFRPAADARARLMAERGDYKQLAKTLSEEAAATADSWLARETLMRAAAVEAELLGDPAAAVDNYRQVLERAAGQRGAMLAMEELRTQLHDREGLCELYAHQLQSSDDAILRAAVLRDMAHACREAAASEALEAYRQLLRLQPNDVEAREALLSAARADDDAQAVVEHASVLAAASQDPALVATYHAEIAERFEVADPKQALKLYRAGLAVDPHSLLCIRGLSRAAVAVGDATALSEAARHEGSAGTDRSLAVALFIRAALVHHRCGEPAAAIEDVAQVLDLHPGSVHAAEMLGQLLQDSGEIARLCELLARAADRCGDAPHAARLYAEVAALRSGPLGDLAGGLTAAERALGHEAGNLRALQILSELLIESGQWARAAEVLEARVQASSDPTQRLHALLALGRLALERLDDPGRAERCVKEVLHIDPNDRAALTLMGALHQRAGRGQASLEVAERLVQTASDPDSRAQALLAKASILRQQGQLEEAERAIYEALSIQGPGSPSDAAYKAQIGKHFGWQRYVDALAEHLKVLHRVGARLGPTALAIANAQLEGLGDAQGALQTLVGASQREPDDPALWDRYAQLLVAGGAIDRAIEIYRAQLTRHPQQAVLWRGLSAAHQAAGRSAEASAVGQALLLLDAAEGEQHVALSMRQAQAVPTADPLGAELLHEVDPQAAIDGPIAQLARAILPMLTRLYPGDAEAYGIAHLDRVPDESGDPLRLAADRVACCVGADDYELYLHDQERPTIDLLLGDKPMLLVARSVAALPRSVMVFHLARPLFCIAQGLSVVHALDSKQLAIALSATVRRQHAGYGTELAPEDELDSVEKAISKAVPWLGRKKLDEVASAVASEGAVDLEAWIEQVRVVAARVALLLCDDLCGALQSLQAERGASAFADPLGRELLRLWASETALLHRQALRSAG